MAIRTYLTSTLGLSHLFMLNDLTRDAGSTGVSTSATLSTGSFVADPICNGVVNSYQSTTVAGTTGVANGIVVGNTSDINAGGGIFQEYSIICWFRIPVIDVPTCVYEQGGGTNNKAINVGLAKAITSQSADAGQPFLIAQSGFLTEANRPYFITHVWQRHTEHAGSGNRIILYINGVEQQTIEDTGTEEFPNHTGDICIGNSNDTLQSYNGSTQRYNAREKNVNMFGILSGGVITAAQTREIFERTVLPQVTIVADTVANQQAALDLLIGNSYFGVNCAIRIVQATDATDYRLFIDDISFTEDSNLRDISIQYVGSNTLTLENVNGSNTNEVSTPPEVDLDGATVLTGGGSISILNDNRIRLNALTNLNGVTADKVIIEVSGSYNFTDCNITEIENVSGGAVTINLANTVAAIEIETSGTITQVQAPTPSDITLNTVGRWAIYNNTNTLVTSGTGNTTYSNTGGVDVGTWSIVSHNLGSVAEIYTWDSEDGSSNTFNYSNTQLLKPEGGSIYSGGATTGINVFINGSNYIEVNVPNSSNSAQSIIDAQQNFINTDTGLTHILNSGVTSAPIFGVLNGVTYFLNIEGYQYDSIAGATPEAALSGVLVSSATHSNILTTNGGLTVLAATESLTAQDIWDYLTTNISTSGSIGEALINIKPDLEIINNGVQNSSLVIPHTTDLT